MSILLRLQATAKAALVELSTKPYPSELPATRELEDLMAHSLSDMETYDDVKQFWLRVEQGSLVTPHPDPFVVYQRMNDARENIRELAAMIPVWNEKKHFLARATILDCAKKVERAQELCRKILLPTVE